MPFVKPLAGKENTIFYYSDFKEIEAYISNNEEKLVVFGFPRRPNDNDSGNLIMGLFHLKNANEMKHLLDGWRGGENVLTNATL